MYESAKDLLVDLSRRFVGLGGPRNAALGRTLSEHAEDLAGYQPADVAQAWRTLAQEYASDPPTDPAWIARAETVREVSIEIDSRVGPLSSSASGSVWDDLIRGVERRLSAAPEQERPRYEAMLFTMRYERRMLGEAMGEGDAGPYPRRGGFTPRTGPSTPQAASFSR